MQISKILTSKKVLAMTAGLVVAGTIGFSAPAQAHGGYYGGCSTCKVVKYRTYGCGYNRCSYRTYGCGYNKCSYRNYCNSCSYRSYGCGSSCCGGYGYGNGYYYGGYYY